MARRFANLDPRQTPHGMAALLRWAVLDRLAGRRRIAPAGAPAPSVAADVAAVRDRATPRVTWIGHASFLVTLGGGSVLVDPVFSSRIATVIRRHGRPGLTAADLPPLEAVVVTHNHYDHLDAPSLKALPRDLPVLVPEGLGPWFTSRRFTGVREMAWWSAVEAGPLKVTCVPARHWSRRRFGDTNRSHWCGVVLEGGGLTVYHAGDTGFFAGFEAIADRFPKIDLALLPIGAYTPAWFMEPNHLNPDQAVRAFEVLGARTLIPMHWGAVQLADEPLCEPIERLRQAWNARRPAGCLHVLAVGESLVVGG